jgi:hypothetical protein
LLYQGKTLPINVESGRLHGCRNATKGKFVERGRGEGQLMSRIWIVCAMCHGRWRLEAVESPYLEMQLMSQPCPHCEAYTLSCRPAREEAAFSVAAVEGPSNSLAEVWRATEG